MIDENKIVSQALEILRKRVTDKRGRILSQPKDARNLLKLELGAMEHEIFGVIALDTQMRYLDHEVLFRGSLLYTAVSPREVIKYAMRVNASALILYHNHPTGSKMPSPDDKQLTKILKDILHIIDVHVADHIIIAGDSVTSFNDLGIMPE